MNYRECEHFIQNKMRKSHVYQPVMLMTLLKSDGKASATAIAKAILKQDESQIEYYEKIVGNMVGRVLRIPLVPAYQSKSSRTPWINRNSYAHFSAKFSGINSILLWMSHRQWHKVGVGSFAPAVWCAKRKFLLFRSLWNISRTTCCRRSLAARKCQGRATRETL